MSSEMTLQRAARAIRPYLKELVGEQEAEVLDRRLAELLCSERGSEQAIEAEIGRLLMRHPETNRWSAVFIERRCPPNLHRLGERSFNALLGEGQLVTFNLYACPHNDFEWYQRAVGVDIPRCPTHDCALEPVEPESGDTC